MTALTKIGSIFVLLSLSVFAAYPEWDSFERLENLTDLQSTHWTVIKGVAGITNFRALGYSGHPVAVKWASETGLNANQFAQGKVYGTAGPAVRMTDSGDTWYDCIGGNDGATQLRRVTSGSPTVLESTNVVGEKAVNEDLITLTVSSTTLTCTVYNEWSSTVRKVLTTTDANHASGGVGFVIDNAYGRTLDSWAGGNITSSPLPVPFSAGAGEYYVSPTGSIGGSGTYASPYRLDAVLAEPAMVPAGTTVWLKAGTYTPDYQVYKPGQVWKFSANGTSTNRVTFSNYPGEEAVLDANIACTSASAYHIVYQDGDYQTIRGIYNGLRVTNSNTACKVITQCGSNPTGTPLTSFRSFGAYLQLHGVVIHDTAQGVASQQGSTGGSFVGNLTFNNGWNAPDRLHGQGAYLQNEFPGTARKEFKSNFHVRNYVTQTEVYSQSGVSGANFLFQDNIFIAGNGISKGSGLGEGLLVQAGDTDNHTWTGNALYTTRFLFNNDDVLSNNLILTGNYLDGVLEMARTNAATVTGNTISDWSTDGSGVSYALRFKNDGVHTTVPTSYTSLNNNTWYSARSGNDTFAQQITGGSLNVFNWAGWQGTGADADSTFNAYGSFFPALNTTAGGSATNFTRVVANPEQPGSGMVAVYNWQGLSAVTVNVSSILSSGDPYEVIDLQNWSAGPIATGTFGGTTISIAMTGTTIQTPTGSYQADPGGTCTAGSDGGTPSGHAEPTPKHTETYFGSFMVRRRQTWGTATLSFRGSTADVLSYGILSPAGIRWDFGPTPTVSCAAGLCSASIPAITGTLFYRINGLMALKVNQL